ncbi:peptidoglycan-binding domain-containing protein [Phytoactinopolyspora limicola]|uniref:peptidoglycan-binding domain-containing protein n=1 Tax=Phytoactinopolyspora limicola TaxID=2715536 RepID=UPI0014085126|nr:peptidoglycan-binding domain-containing protein [Phytoactinopolyspora limicola]
MSRGDRGDDVAQLQEFLTDIGHYEDATDGRYGEATYWAVRSWQEELGVPVDGVVRHEDVVFVDSLPARLALDPSLEVGMTLAGGEPAAQRLDSEPAFVINLPEGQAQWVHTGQIVEIDQSGSQPWLAEIASIGFDDETAQRYAELDAASGESICGDECDVVPLGDASLFPSMIQVVPDTEGTIVPIAALVTDAAGSTGVIRESGDFHPVDMVEYASGLAVVEGLDAGSRVRVPGDVGQQVPDDQAPDAPADADSKTEDSS